MDGEEAGQRPMDTFSKILSTTCVPGLVQDSAGDTGVIGTALGPTLMGLTVQCRRQSRSKCLDDRVIPSCDRCSEGNTQNERKGRGSLLREVREGTLVRAETEPRPAQWERSERDTQEAEWARHRAERL